MFVPGVEGPKGKPTEQWKLTTNYATTAKTNTHDGFSGVLWHPARVSRFLLSHTECQNAPEEPDAHAVFQLCRVKPYTRRGR
jgi:hypothetical protein